MKTSLNLKVVKKVATLFFVSIYSVLAFAQNEGEMIAMDNYTDGSTRTIITKTQTIKTIRIDCPDEIRPSFSISRIKLGKSITYFLDLKMSSRNELHVSKGQPILFKINNYTIRKQAADDIECNYSMQYRTGWYDNSIVIELTYDQIKLLSVGNVTKIRVKTDIGNVIDIYISGNDFSNSIKKCLNAISYQIKKNNIYKGF